MKTSRLFSLALMLALLLPTSPIARTASSPSAPERETLADAILSASLIPLTFPNIPVEKAAVNVPSSPPLSADTGGVSLHAVAQGAKALAAGLEHTCALTSGGGVKCWGRNFWGQLGDGTTTDRLTPVDVVGLADVSAIAAGLIHACALTSEGGVKCWGNNHRGQLGDGTTIDRLTPVDVSGLTSGISAIATRGDHTCALTGGGGVKCWGDNFSGQLGDGTTTDRLTPVDVVGPADISAIAAAYAHTCALTISGEVKCWGWNERGQLGDGTNVDRLTPVDVVGLTDISTVAAGLEHTCALTISGGVKCWGSNGSGILGDGTTTDRLTPVDVLRLADVSAIAAGNWHTCALTSGGGAKCWGYNQSGQLGDGTTTNRHTPVDVVGFEGVGSLSGIVFDGSTKTPLGDVQININGPTLVTTTIGGGGAYAFVDIPAGTYSFAARKSGYDTITEQLIVRAGVATVYNPIMSPAFSLEELAFRYAPVWHQDTDRTGADGLDGRADYITKFNFDSEDNWIGIDNWNNLPTSSAKGYVYYSIVETGTHWFILYADFHPRDWAEDGLGGGRLAHENDMEGALVVVAKKEGEDYGEFLLMETNAHDTWRRYTINPALVADRDGDIEFWNDTHPRLFVEARGHGVCSWTDLGFSGIGSLDPICRHDSGQFPGPDGGDGVVYYYTGAEPKEPDHSDDRDVPYGLLHIDDLWNRRCHTNVHDPDNIWQHPFEAFGIFDGNEGIDDAAKAPWGWDGDIFRDPANRILEDFSHIGDAGTFDTSYVYNPYEAKQSIYLPAAGGMLISFDCLDHFTLPEDMADETLLISNTFARSIPPTSDLVALKVFELSAVSLDTGSPVTDFQQPYQIAIRYTDGDAQGIFEPSLGLYLWNSSRWVLEPTSAVNTETNTVTATPNHMSIFAVLGREKHTVLLPLVVRE